MKYFKVIGIAKATKQKIIIEPHLTEAQAMVICESWGWMYDDGTKAYYMDIEEDEQYVSK